MNIKLKRNLGGVSKFKKYKPKTTAIKQITNLFSEESKNKRAVERVKKYEKLNEKRERKVEKLLEKDKRLLRKEAQYQKAKRLRDKVESNPALKKLYGWD